MNQEHLINVDYNMGMDIDLVDRDLYLPQPKIYTGSQQRKLQQDSMGYGLHIKVEDDTEAKQSEKNYLEHLRKEFLDEKDQFILSEKETFEDDEEKVQKLEKKIKIPARYEMVDKVNKWGGEQRDPLAIKEFKVQN